MHARLALAFSLLTFPILAQWTIQNGPPASPEQLNQELESAEAQFNRAKQMFNPWYTGPLITPSASMMPPGYGNFQPYIFVAGNYARYNSERSAQSIPTLMQLKSSNIVQFGITNTMDIIAIPTFEGQWQSGQSGGGFGDLPITIGFPIYLQTRYVPQIKFTIQELFPTGRYQHLSSNGLALSGLGQGSYQTTFGLAFGKLLFWTTQHPVNTRLFLGYTIPTPVHVKGFNSYGGGHGTNGTVKPGKTFAADLGIEYSITQSWVFACDFVYTATNATTFNGTLGTVNGLPAAVGGGFNDNFSLAPAFEYNWSENLGMLGGVWFSVYGRNSLAFAQGILSITWTFAVN